MSQAQVGRDRNKRDDIRAKIFAAKRQRKKFKLFGEEVELAQPTLGNIVEAPETSARSQTIRLIIENTYIPGTNERVFETADFDGLMNLPFGADFRELNEALNEMMGISMEELRKKKGNSKGAL